MNNTNNNIITPSQMTALLVGTVIGAGILNLPYSVVKIAHQDGWISVILMAIYPLYMALLATFISSKHPTENILKLSKIYLGKFIGTIFNIFFMTYFIFFTSVIVSGFTNVIVVYIVSFLSPIKVFAVTVFLALYVSYKGLKVVGRVNEILLYLTIALIFIPVSAIKYGSLLNISPIFGSGIKNISKATIESIYSYGGIEILFLFYPYLSDIKKVKNSSIKAIVIIAFSYIWLTFITIFFLGPDIVLKSLWPTVVVTESIKTPVITSFRFIFMYLWSIVVFKCIGNFYFASVYIIKDIFGKCNIEILNFIVYPIVIFISLNLGDEIKRRKVASTVIPLYTFIIVIFISIICLLILKKSGDKNKSKNI